MQIMIYAILRKFLLLFVFIFTFTPTIFSQNPCAQDTVSPFCFIESFTVKGNIELGGSPIYFPRVAYDHCSGVTNVEYFIINQGKEIVEGEILGCGNHVIQGIFIDANDNLSSCEFVVSVNCDVNIHAGLFPHQLNEKDIDHSQRIINDHGVRITDFELGSLSVIWESGKRGPGTISKGVSDPGGSSYGIYQLSHKQGYLDDFLDKEGIEYKDQFGTLKPGSKAFNLVWKDIAKKDPKAFRKAQHRFIKRTHYDKYSNRVKRQVGLNVDNYSMVLKDVLWSTAVQHGPYNNIFKHALIGEDLTQITEEDIIKKVYAERGRMNGDQLANFSRVGNSWKKSLIQRFKSEERVALFRLDTYYDNFAFASTTMKANNGQKQDNEDLMEYQDIKTMTNSSEKPILNEVQKFAAHNTTEANQENTIVSSEYDLKLGVPAQYNDNPKKPGSLQPISELDIMPHSDIKELHNTIDISSSIISNINESPLPLNVKDESEEEYKPLVTYRVFFVILNEADAIFPDLADLGIVIRDTLKHINKTRYLIGEFDSKEVAVEVQQRIAERGYRASKVIESDQEQFASLIN